MGVRRPYLRLSSAAAASLRTSRSVATRGGAAADPPPPSPPRAPLRTAALPRARKNGRARVGGALAGAGKETDPSSFCPVRRRRSSADAAYKSRARALLRHPSPPAVARPGLWPASAGAPLRFSFLPRPPAPSPAMASPERDGQRDQLSDPDEQLDFVHQHKKFTRDAYLRLLAPYRFLCEYGPPPRPPSPARPFFPSPFGRRLRSGGRAQHDGHPPEEERAGQVRAGGQI